jgi:hypothetical protein
MLRSRNRQRLSNSVSSEGLTPSSRFRLLRRAELSPSAANIHSDPRIKSLVGHVVNPLTIAANIAFDNAVW